MVNARSKKQAIFTLKPFLICLTIAPGFAVTCAEVLWSVYLGYPTEPLDTLHVLAEKALTSTSHDNLLFLGLCNGHVRNNFVAEVFLPLDYTSPVCAR